MASLLVGHCAGMLDLVALPVWVGANLVGWFQLDPQKAGLLATLFLSGQVVSSMFLAPRFGRVPARLLAAGGFGVGALAFFGLAMTSNYLAMLALHLMGGLGAGCALTMVHGTMGRSIRPHRLFAFAGLTLACFGIVILGSGKAIIAAASGHALFLVFGAVMAVAALLAACAFPRARVQAASQHAAAGKLSPRVWAGMIGMGIFCMAQSMIFPFIERIGIDRGYSIALVSTVLMAIGFCNLMPTPLAALLEKRVRAESAILAGIVVHIAIITAITQLPGIETYAIGVALVTTPMLFVHTFLFGLLARLDPSGRSLAATPAMVMIGSTIGPVFGGTLVMAVGYSGLGIGVVMLAIAAAACFYKMGKGE
ncbi:MFS transporter [Massilia cavernae]|uniref:MFS transporter n=1 Tax=Massilia cavernae TaxID=2320864 RepID=A0A418Y6T1_9BURK|nr:MFS transporter [Massilia cavernae]